MQIVQAELNPNKILFLISLGLFAILFQMSNSINFMQNDDWVHYSTVENFISMDFSLHEIIGSTFYTQGLIGFLFAKLFGLMNLPILTLIFSVVNFYIFSKILIDKLNINVIFSVLIALVLFLNPIHFYSIIGFMTENFFITFMLAGIYISFSLIENIEKSKKIGIKNLTIFILIVLFGFFIKQSFIFLPLGLGFYFLIKKHIRYSIYLLSTSFLLFGYYSYFFPKTEIMSSQFSNIELENLLNLSNMFSHIYIIVAYVSIFLAPLVLISVYSLFQKTFANKKFLLIIGFIFTSLILFFLFKNLNTYLENFPYLINVFDRKGFFPSDLNGNKYHWIGFYKFFELIEIIGFTFSGSIIFGIIYKFAKNNFSLKFTHFILIFYIGIIYSSNQFYDRYLLPIFFISAIALIELFDLKNVFKSVSNASKIIIASFIFLLIFLNYLFAFDYIKWQNHVWSSSTELFMNNRLDPSQIKSSRAWNRYYAKDDTIPKFSFSFDSPDIYNNPDSSLYNEYEIDFPLNIFINSNVYTYRINDE